MKSSKQVARQAPSFDLSQQLLVSPGQAAVALCVGRSVVYKLINEGSIRSVKHGKSRRIIVASLHDFVNRLEDAGE
jgi:excisionase family DNA binding protein